MHLIRGKVGGGCMSRRMDKGELLRLGSFCMPGKMLRIHINLTCEECENSKEVREVIMYLSTVLLKSVK